MGTGRETSELSEKPMEMLRISEEWTRLRPSLKIYSWNASLVRSDRQKAVVSRRSGSKELWSWSSV